MATRSTSSKSGGRRKSLKALGARKRANVSRVAKGKKPIVAGKKVSAKSIGLSKTKAREQLAARRKSS
jgi:hypothetical protein